MSKYSIIIPVYRGEKTIEELSDRIMETLANLKQEFEILFIWDSGIDNSWEIIKKLCIKYPQSIKGVRLSRNYGQHNATICGIKYALGEWVITLDEDLQHNPLDIPLLLQKQQEKDYDIIYGAYNERKHSSFRNYTSYLLKLLLKLGIPDLHQDYSSFRLIRASIAKRTLDMNNSYTFLDGYLTWLTKHTSSVQVTHEESKAGVSSYNIKKLIEHSINIFVTFSNLPIRLLTLVSAMFFSFSFIYGTFILLRKIIYEDLISGFASIAVILGFGLGTIILGIGIIGEYIHRINLKTTAKPNFNEVEII